MLTLSGPLTHREAPRVLREGEAQLGQARQVGTAAVRVDCAGLSQVDSSALAVLLSWQRTAQAAGIALDIAAAPRRCAISPRCMASTPCWRLHRPPRHPITRHDIEAASGAGRSSPHRDAALRP